jgi:hypothetical protein
MAEDNKTRGLYGKYDVRRSDGTSGPGGKHEHCDFFVLDLTHDPLALAALATYAEGCSHDFPMLYDDLNDKLARLRCGAFPYRTCVPLRKSGDGPLQECVEPAVIPLGNGCWFCIEHAQDYERRAYPLGLTGKGTLERRLARRAQESTQ